MRSSTHAWLFLAAAGILLPGSASAQVAIRWVNVGGAGNACDTQTQGCFGSVATPYRISKFEITNGNYADFLNAVAASDPAGLYNTNMGSDPEGGITRSGAPGSYEYDIKPGRQSTPVNFVSFWDAIRFANWLHNDQPTGAQGPGTTETGAYTITGDGILFNTITRNEGARVFVANEDEWYKAAYYDTDLDLYYDYPAGFDGQTDCSDGTGGPNEANCSDPGRGLTDVGGYSGSPSPNGTFDQGGNVWEWNEAIIAGSFRGLRGGNFINEPSFLAASYQGGSDPASELVNVGFRVASPVPPIPSTSPLGLGLLCGLLGFAAWRRLRG